MLRAVAVLGVVAFHATKNEFAVGAAGVDIFFVLSGFIMAQVAPGRERTEFIAARVWRILPIYFICLALYASTRTVPPDSCRVLFSMTLLPLWGDCFPYIVQAWSLSFELLFYALVAIFIRRLDVLFVVIPLLVGLRFFVPGFSFLGNHYLIEFVFGLLIARIPLRYGLAILGGGIFLLFLAPIDNKSPWRVITWGIPSALIVYGALALERFFDRRAFNAPVWIGDASYSIYLGHALFMPVLLPPAMWAALAVAGSCVIYIFIEKPLIEVGKSLFARKPAVLRLS